MQAQCGHARQPHRVQLPPGVKDEASPQSEAQPTGCSRASPCHPEAHSVGVLRRRGIN